MITNCAKCGEEVDAGTQKCPNCGHRPQKSMQMVGVFIAFVGIAISLTGVGAVVGIPLALFGGYRLIKGGKLTVESEYGA